MNLIFKSPKFMNYALPFLGGIFYSMGFPMDYLPHFFAYSLFGTYLLFQALPFFSKDRRPYFKNYFLPILLFSLAYSFSGYYWIPYTLKEFGEIPFPLNSILGGLFSLIIVPQFILMSLLLYFLNRAKSNFLNNSKIMSLGMALIITLLEFYTPQQFPAHLGHSWMSIAPNLGLAPILGAPGFSFFSYWLVLSVIGQIREKKWAYLPLLSFVIFLILNITLSLKIPSPTQTTKLRLIQPNISNFVKIHSEKGGIRSRTDTFARYRSLSTKDEKELDLIIWPETAYPDLLNSAFMRITKRNTPPLIREVIAKTNAQLMTGGYDFATQNQGNLAFETQYNSTFFFDRKAEFKDVYHKRKLIPFGESLPLGPLNPFIANAVNNISFFAQGKRFPVFELDNGVSLINAICYEILFSQETRDYLNSTSKRPHFILNMTNDSWYGPTAEPYQHQYLAQWRAIEFKIPIVRITNTGLTSVLYADGSKSKDMGIFRPGVKDIDLQTSALEVGLFQRFGILNLLFVWILLATLQISLIYIKKTEKSLP